MLKKYLSTIFFVAVCLLTAAPPAPAQSETAKTAAVLQAPAFDDGLQSEFEKGLQGDSAALERAVKATEKILVANPKDALALVWQGAGKLRMSADVFMSGDFSAGFALWKTALEEMAKAVEIAPDDPKVLVVRASTLRLASKQFPDPDESRRLLQTSIGDFEKILAVAGEKFKELPDQMRGTVVFGLAEGYDRQGEKTKARKFYERIAANATGNMREIAVKWLEANKPETP